MKYVRTKDGIHIKNIFGKETDEKEWESLGYKIIKQADTIEELMMVGDLVFKESGDIFVIQNQAQIDFYIKYKIVSKLFIEDSNGNYIKVAQKETEKGDLYLL